LHSAVSANRIGVIQVLLANNANPNSREKTGKTPLHFAASEEAVDLLLAHGADINAVAADGLTPIDEARHANRIDIATYMHQQSLVNAKAHGN
jgi:ankyrin repeat protein